MDFITQYISVIALVAALCVGFILKNLVPNDEVNKFIPLIAAVIGLVICLWEANWIATPETVVMGVVSGLASTGLYEAFKNFIGQLKVTPTE